MKRFSKRLKTDQFFHYTPVYSDEPEKIKVKGFMAPIRPRMHPPIKEGACKSDFLYCKTGAKGNSGAGLVVDGSLVGVFNWSRFGAGPSDIQKFLRESDRTRFLLNSHPAVTPPPTCTSSD